MVVTATMFPSTGHAFSPVSLSGTSGSISYSSPTCGSPDYEDWYKPAALGTPLPQNDCGYQSYYFYAGTGVTGPIKFTLTNGSLPFYNNTANDVGFIAGWLPAPNSPPDEATCNFIPNPTGTTVLDPELGGGYFIASTVVITIPPPGNQPYCIFVGAGYQAGVAPSNLSYTLTWAPDPAAASSPVTDGPIPPWTYGLPGLAMFIIAKRQMVPQRKRV
jgi:hypothetical protein